MRRSEIGIATMVGLGIACLLTGCAPTPPPTLETPSVPEAHQALEFVLRLGPEFGSRQRYTFQVDRPGTVDVYCTWTGSAQVLAGILNGPVRGRKDEGSPIHMVYQVEEKHLARSKNFSLSVVNFRGGEAQGTIRLSFPSDPRSISVTQVDQAYVKRVLSIQEGKKAAKRTVFDKIDHATIAGAAFTADKVNGSNDENNDLTPGSVFLCKTSKGRLCKFLVEEYGYNLVVSWTTYNLNGDIHSEGKALKIRGTWSCDLDQGKETSDGADFWWQQVTERERFLTPKNGALFARLPSEEKSSE